MTLGLLQILVVSLIAVLVGVVSLSFYRRTQPERVLSKKIFLVLSGIMLLVNAAALMAADGRYYSDVTSGLLLVFIYTSIMIPVWSAIGVALVTVAATVGNIVRPDRSIFPDTWYKVCVGAALGLVCAPLLLYVVAYLSNMLD